MRTHPKKWTKHHTARIFHLSVFLCYCGFFALISIQLFTFYYEAVALPQDPPLPNSLSINTSATVPKIYPGPSQIENNNPQNTNTKSLDQNQKLSQSSGEITVLSEPQYQTNKTLNNQNWEFTFATQKPVFFGNTSIKNALIFLELNSFKTIKGTASADENGYWFWQSPEAVEPGTHNLKVIAQDPFDPSLKAGRNIVFLINLPQKTAKEAKIPPTNIEKKLGSLFDIFIKIPAQFKNVSAGNEIIAEIKLTNFGTSQAPVDVTVEFLVEDPEGSIVMDASETVAVATQLSILKTFYTNQKLLPGSYKLIARVPSEDLIATASDQFEIKTRGVPATQTQTPLVRPVPILLYQALLALGLLFAIVTYMEYNKVALLSRVIKKIDEHDLALNI